MPAERADRIGYPGDENALRGQGGRDRVKGLEHLRLAHVFQHVGGGNGGERSRPAGQERVVITQAHLVQAGRAGDRHLFWRHIDALGLVSVGEQQPDQFALTAADVGHRARRGQRRPDVAPVDQARRLAVATAGVL
jgi:hypothetical protein